MSASLIDVQGSRWFSVCPVIVDSRSRLCQERRNVTRDDVFTLSPVRGPTTELHGWDREKRASDKSSVQWHPLYLAFNADFAAPVGFRSLIDVSRLDSSVTCVVPVRCRIVLWRFVVILLTRLDVFFYVLLLVVVPDHRSDMSPPFKTWRVYPLYSLMILFAPSVVLLCRLYLSSLAYVTTPSQTIYCQLSKNDATLVMISLALYWSSMSRGARSSSGQWIIELIFKLSVNCKLNLRTSIWIESRFSWTRRNIPSVSIHMEILNLS